MDNELINNIYHLPSLRVLLVNLSANYKRKKNKYKEK